MPIDDVVVSAEHCLKRSLEPIEKLILQASWQGQPYNVIAETSGYANVYVREVGARLWQALSEALGTKVTKKTLSLVMEATARPLPNQLNYPSGPLPVDSPLYVERTTLMTQALAALAHPGCLIRVQGARCMGKTSFLFRVLNRAREQGYGIAVLSFRQVEPAVTEQFSSFARWFVRAISAQLGQTGLGLWDIESPLGDGLDLSAALKSVLHASDQPLILTLRDLDTLHQSAPGIAATLSSLIVGWQEEARRDQTWSKLRMAVSYTCAIESVEAVGQWLGLNLRLRAFTVEQVVQLAQAYGWINVPREGLTVASQLKVEQLMEWVGGHPYLLALAFYHLGRRQSLDALIDSSMSLDGIFNSYLRSYLGWLQEQPEVAVALRTVVSAKGPVSLPPSEESALEAAGLVELDAGQARPTCKLYRQYFGHHLRFVSAFPMPTIEISDLQRLEARIEGLSRRVERFSQISYLDRLSQFTNREFFERQVQQSCNEANQNKSSLALLLCAFDHYDVYANAYGCIQAEDVLRQIADCLRECVEGPVENFSRYGHEQFIVLVDDCSLERVLAMANRLREQVEALAIPQSIGYMGWSQVVTVSIGVASKNSRSQVTPAQLLSTAEHALAQAQRQGNNCIEVQDC